MARLVDLVESGCNDTVARGHKDQARTGGRMPLWHLPIPMLWNGGTCTPSLWLPAHSVRAHTRYISLMVNPWFFELIQGMDNILSPTHTLKDCVESDLSTLKLFAQFTVLLLRGFWAPGLISSQYLTSINRARSGQNSIRAFAVEQNL
eukprot:1137708-Pelagomonas_calceolata.AAC.1